MMKSIIKFLILICMTLGICGCQSTSKQKEENMINPWQQVETIQQASTICGFDIVVPDIIENGNIVTILVTEDILEVNYDNDITIRKGLGNQDISGDYSTYNSVVQQSLNNINVTMKGNNNTYNNIVYYSQDYAYSIYSKKGLSIEVITYLIENIN